MKTFKQFLDEASETPKQAKAHAIRLTNKEMSRPGGPRSKNMQRIGRAYGSVVTKLLGQQLRDEDIVARREQLKKQRGK